MRAFEVLGNRVFRGIEVKGEPPAVVLGGGDLRLPIRVGVGWQDAAGLICSQQGMRGICQAGVMPLYGRDGKPNGRFFIVKPDLKIQNDTRTLVCWRFPSGRHGAAQIRVEGIRVISQGVRMLPAPDCGEVAEVLAIIQPGQELWANRSGQGISYTHARLVWDGQILLVRTGWSEIFKGQSKEHELLVQAS